MDSRRQAKVDVEDIGACIDIPQETFLFFQGDYTILNRWYQHALARKPNPLWADIEKVYRDYAALYQQEEPSPPGRPVTIHIAPFQIEDGVPTWVEV